MLQTLEIREPTYERWRNQYGGMKAEVAKRLKQLEENRRLKNWWPRRSWTPRCSNTPPKETVEPFPEACGGRGPPTAALGVRAKGVQGVGTAAEHAALRVPAPPGRRISGEANVEIDAAASSVGLPANGRAASPGRLAGQRTRIYRLWRREGMKVSQKKRKRRPLGTSTNGCAQSRAESPNHVWC